MTPMQLERAAGEAMGLHLNGRDGVDAFLWVAESADIWAPLSIDEQAMALVRHFHLHIDQRPGKQITVQPPDFSDIVVQDARHCVLNLNQAIVECAARMRR